MNQKVGRNDPCTCGSGKKYKNCCLNKVSVSDKMRSHKLKAKWLNAPQEPNLMERTFGDAITSTGKVFDTYKDEDFKKIEEERGDDKGA
jgi:uncharacterized protein